MLNPRHVAVSTAASSKAPSAAAADGHQGTVCTQGCELSLQAPSPCSSRLPVQQQGNSPSATKNMGCSEKPPSSSSSPGQRATGHRAEPQDTGLQLHLGCDAAGERQEARKDRALKIRNITNLIFNLRAVHSL